MKSNFWRFVKYSLLVCFAFFAFKVFLPKNYPVPKSVKRESSTYWELSSGSKIGYTLVPGKGEKKPYPIIYLHGGPGGFVRDSDIKVLSALTVDGYDIYLYDQAGSGQSGRLHHINEYSVDRHINDLKEIINIIGAEKVLLIGQSWGGILAALFAATNAEKIEKIIFTSPGPIYPVRKELANITPPDSFHLRQPYYSNQQGNEKANNIRTKAMFFLATSFNIQLASNNEADNFSTYLTSEVNKSTVCDTSNIVKTESGSGYYAQIMTFKSLLNMQDPRPGLKNSKISILVMKGQCDNQKWGFTNEYLELFTNHQLAIIPDAGHFISVEQPEIYVTTIRDFLNR